MYKKVCLFIVGLIFINYLCSQDINEIKLPEGFKIEVYVEGLSKPRGVTISTDDTIFTGSKSGYIYKIAPDRSSSVIDRGLNGPIGIDLYNGDLYVSEINQIRVYPDIFKQKEPYYSIIINKSIPDQKWHGWKYLKVGNDNKIYINIGVPCNVCKSDDKFIGTITTMNLDGSNQEVYAFGVRNSVGFDWNPLTGNLWFTDNGADNFGDNIPPDELNKVVGRGEHFGFPYIHGKSFRDPTYFTELKDIQVEEPQWELPAHVAALGMRFYTGNSFPDYYKNGIFIAEHGSWNRSKKTGYRVSFIKIVNNKAVSYEVFAEGWTIKDKAWGRPVDLDILSDGSIVLTDDLGDRVFRIYYHE